MHAVVFGTVFRLILKFFVSGLQERKVLVPMKLCGLWRPEGQLGLLSCARAAVDCSWKASPAGTASRSASTFPESELWETG